MSNPLVAPTQDSTTAMSGVPILEDAKAIKDGIQNGSWASTVMGVAGAAMDTLAFVADPFGSILASGVGWLMEHVGPLKEALDALAGNPDQITAHSQTWKNIAKEVGDVSADLAKQVKADVQSWTGPGADAYRKQAEDTANVLEGASQACEGAADGVKTAGEVVAAVRMLVRDIIAQVVGHMISWALQVLFTAGIGMAWVLPQVVNLVAKTAKQLAELIKSLTKALKALGELLGKAGKLFGNASKALKNLKPGSKATPGKIDTLPSGAKDVPASGKPKGGEDTFGGASKSGDDTFGGPPTLQNAAQRKAKQEADRIARRQAEQQRLAQERQAKLQAHQQAMNDSVGLHSFPDRPTADGFMQTHYPGVQGINKQNWDNGVAGHDNNCGNCTIATAQSITHGKQWTANPANPMKLEDVENMAHQQAGYGPNKFTKLNDYNELNQQIASAPPGSVASVAVKWDGQQVGHFFNVHAQPQFAADGSRLPNKPVYLDGQTGMPADISRPPSDIWAMPFQ